MAEVKVERLCVGAMEENCYLVSRPGEESLFIVDPGAEAERVAAAVGTRRPEAVLLTHAHFDHMGAADALCSRYQIPLYVHEADAAKLNDPLGNVSALFGQPLQVCATPVLLCDGQELTLAGLSVRTMHTPGHSAGSCCFLVENDACVFTGDTLFNGGYGRTDFPDGDFTALRESLGRLFKLTPKRPAWPGHGGATFAGRDRKEENQ